MPKKTLKINKYIYYVLLSLNIVMPLIASVLSIISTTIYFNNPAETKLFYLRALKFSDFVTPVLGVLSGIFLFYAVFTINKFLKKGITAH